MAYRIRRHSFVLLALLLGVVVIAAACSSGDDETTTATSSSGTTSGTTSAPAAPAPAAAPTAAAPAPATDTSMDAAAAAPKPVYGGTVRFAQQRDNRVGWDPHATRGGQSLLQNTSTWWFNGLMSRAYGTDVSGGVSESFPDLAESWEVSNGGKTYTFKLRQGVKFHNKPPVNGRELTSEDVKWSYERFLDGPDSDKWQLGDIASIETPDKYTVVMNLKDPVVSFLHHVGEPLALILPKEAASSPPKTPSLKLPEEFIAPDGIIGTGPFIFESHEKDKKVVAVRNPDYFKTDEQGNQLPFLDQLEYVVIPDAAARLAAFTAGEIATVAPASGSTQEALQQNPKANFSQDQPTSPPQYAFRLDRDLFKDVRLRRAVSMAIDQQAYMDQLRGSISARTWGSAPATAFPEFDITTEELGPPAQWWQYNPQASRDLLAEAGYGPNNPLEFTFQFSSCCLPTYLPDLVASMLEDVGIKANINVVDHAVHLKTSNVGIGDYDMAHARVKGAEIDDFLLSFLPDNPKNVSHIDDPTLTKMILAQRLIQDPNERFKAVRDIQRYLADQVYVFYIPDRFADTLWQPWIKGFKNHMGNTEGRDWERAWIDRSGT